VIRELTVVTGRKRPKADRWPINKPVLFTI
jgi:hypothetical protein